MAYRLYRGLGSTDSITALLNQAAAKYNLDPNLLLSLAETESSLNPNAVSSAGAQGIMQLMPATGASMGVSNPFDPSQNIDGGAKYFSQLLSQYGGDTSLALAAYNAGPGNVAKAGNTVPSYSQGYVNTVLAGAGVSSDGTSFTDATTGTDASTSGFSVSDLTDSVSSLVDQSGLSGGALAALGIGTVAVLWWIFG